MRCIRKLPLVAVLSKSHRLSAHSSLQMGDFSKETLVKLEGSFISDTWRFIEGACLSAGFSPKCKHVYFPHITDFLKVTYTLATEVLILTEDYVQQFHSFMAPSCAIIPIDDPIAYMPLSVVYSMNNTNPLIDEALEIILKDSPQTGTDSKGA